MSSLELWDFRSASSFTDIDLTGTSGFGLVSPGPGSAEPLSEELSSGRTELSTGEAGASLGDIRMWSEVGEVGERGLEMELRDSRLSCLCGGVGFPTTGGGGTFL